MRPLEGGPINQMSLNMEFVENIYAEKKYITWDLDLTVLKEKSQFYHDLNEFFDSDFFRHYPDDAAGSAYSVNIIHVPSLHELTYFLTPTLIKAFKQLTNKELSVLNRLWANRMHYGSFGLIHTHNNAETEQDCKVFTMYLDVPVNSSDLVLIDPDSKHRYKKLITDVPQEERLHIPVYEGMCIMYDNDLPHGVSRHNSNLPRHAIIIECS